MPRVPSGVLSCNDHDWTVSKFRRWTVAIDTRATILHADLDAFYASVEQLHSKQKPAGRCSVCALVRGPSSRLFDLNGEASRVSKRQIRAIIPADVRRVSPDIYCLVDGRVSGMKNQRITTASRATNAILRNAAVRPKLAATTPKSVVPSEAPIPDPVPTMPWAKLKRPVPPVTSAMTSAVSTPNTAPLMPSSN